MIANPIAKLVESFLVIEHFAQPGDEKRASRASQETHGKCCRSLHASFLPQPTGHRAKESPLSGRKGGHWLRLPYRLTVRFPDALVPLYVPVIVVVRVLDTRLVTRVNV